MNEREKEYLIRTIHGIQNAVRCIMRALDISPTPALWEVADPLYWAARAAAKASHDMGDIETSTYMDDMADDLVSIAKENNHEIRKG